MECAYNSDDPSGGMYVEILYGDINDARNQNHVLQPKFSSTICVLYVMIQRIIKGLHAS